MIEFVASAAPAALMAFWPITAAILVVAAAIVPRSSALRPFRGFVVVAAIVGSAVGALIISLSQGGSPLIRDVFAAIIVALLAPGVVAFVGVVLGSAPAVARFFGAVAAGMVLLCASPLFLLLVHCTSGDCL